MLKMTSFLLIPFTLCIGCGEPGPNDDWQPVSLTDSGSTCLQAESADNNGSVSVNGDLCLSSSCSRNAVGSCEATLDGNTITVTSQFDWEENVGENVACTDDCGTLVVECGEIGPLPEGTYTLVHGEQSKEVVVPTQDDC